MGNGKETVSTLFLKIIIGKLNNIESRMEKTFINLHTQMSTLKMPTETRNRSCTSSIKGIKSIVDNAWAAIEDVQEQLKIYKSSKRTHQDMLDNQSQEIKLFKGKLVKSQA